MTSVGNHFEGQSFWFISRLNWHNRDFPLTKTNRIESEEEIPKNMYDHKSRMYIRWYELGWTKSVIDRNIFFFFSSSFQHESKKSAREKPYIGKKEVREKLLDLLYNSFSFLCWTVWHYRYRHSSILLHRVIYDSGVSLSFSLVCIIFDRIGNLYITDIVNECFKRC